MWKEPQGVKDAVKSRDAVTAQQLSNLRLGEVCNDNAAKQRSQSHPSPELSGYDQDGYDRNTRKVGPSNVKVHHG